MQVLRFQIRSVAASLFISGVLFISGTLRMPDHRKVRSRRSLSERY